VAQLKELGAMGKQAQRPPELYRIILPVKNIKTASNFYSKLLDLKGKKVSPGRVYFACGQTILACYDPVADGDSLHRGGIYIQSNTFISLLRISIAPLRKQRICDASA
jgi:hypothetical protein